MFISPVIIKISILIFSNESEVSMAFMNWDDKYSVGVKIMDDQHKVLIDLINKLHEAMLAGKGKQEAEVVIKGLVDYTVFHFGEEEKLLTANNYPGLLNQQTKHKGFVSKVQEFQEDVKSGKLAIGMKVSQFLKDWLFEHIMGEDQKYAAFLNNKGIK
jgi:hemerythrin-like metal-binding protein